MSTLWQHTDEDGDRVCLRMRGSDGWAVAIPPTDGEFDGRAVFVDWPALLNLYRAIGEALITDEDRRVLRDCTHGADCPVHPDANRQHNFDPEYAR